MRSPMITVGAIVLPVDTLGITDASAMDNPSTPRTERVEGVALHEVLAVLSVH